MGEGGGQPKFHVTFFGGPFLTINFQFGAVYSEEKANILENEKCHVTGGPKKRPKKCVTYYLNGPSMALTACLQAELFYSQILAYTHDANVFYLNFFNVTIIKVSNIEFQDLKLFKLR
jgi:hypothetical protein